MSAVTCHMSDMDFAEFEKRVGFPFNNKELIRTAFTHRSYLNENRRTGFEHNERLEFVNAVTLAGIAEKLGMNECLLLSRGEAKDTGRARQVILANTIEAFIGALYLDQGYDAAERFISRHLYTLIDEIVMKRTWLDAKSHFQERAQEIVGVTPNYETVKEVGPDHDKRFTVAVFLGRERVAEGEGKSKQEAEQMAAKLGLEAKKWE